MELSDRAALTIGVLLASAYAAGRESADEASAPTEDEVQAWLRATAPGWGLSSAHLRIPVAAFTNPLADPTAIGNHEEVYEYGIGPLVAKIIVEAKHHGIPMLLAFQLSGAEDLEGAIMQVTYHLPPGSLATLIQAATFVGGAVNLPPAEPAPAAGATSHPHLQLVGPVAHGTLAPPAEEPDAEAE